MHYAPLLFYPLVIAGMTHNRLIFNRLQLAPQ